MLRKRMVRAGAMPGRIGATTMKQASIFFTALVMAGGVAWYAMAEQAPPQNPGAGADSLDATAAPDAPSLRPDRRPLVEKASY